jgi:hypothetical protein
MKTVIELIAVLCWLAGLALFVVAFITPNKYAMLSASAIQTTQVYSEALYYAGLSIAALLSGVFLMVTVRKSE